jgi:hypothetical protein
MWTSSMPVEQFLSDPDELEEVAPSWVLGRTSRSSPLVHPALLDRAPAPLPPECWSSGIVAAEAR